MADSEFERFKKMFPRGKKDMNIQAIPAPLPGPGGLLRSAVGQAVQSGVRRFSDVNRADKVTKMKDRKGVERRDPMEPRAASSSGKSSQSGVRRYSDVQNANKTTKMKDRKGVERKEQRPAGRSIIPSVRGGGPAKRQGSSAPSFVAAPDRKSEPMSNADVQKAYQSVNTKAGLQAPVRQQRQLVPSRVKARPADLDTSAKSKKKVEKRKVEKKSKTRIAFEKEFAAARKKGKKSFSSKLGKYGKYSTKLK
jgi:hypothetical protein